MHINPGRDHHHYNENYELNELGAGHSDPVHPAQCAEAAQRPDVALVASHVAPLAAAQRPSHRGAAQGENGNRPLINFEVINLIGIHLN